MPAPVLNCPTFPLVDASSIGTATGSSNAETLNQPVGVITTESLSTAQDAVDTRTLTCNQVQSTSNVLAFIIGGTNTTPAQINAYYASANTITVKITSAIAALNGTIKYLYILC